MPGDPEHLALRDRLMSARVMERFRDTMSTFALPRPLKARTASCGGEVDASYENDEIVVCYEYIDNVVDLSRNPNRQNWISEKEAVAGPILDVFFHEGAHALFEFFRVPILGREEDAADAMSALTILHLTGAAAKPLIGAVAFMYMDEAEVTPSTINRPRMRELRADAFSNEHGSALQRHYNLVCLAYGFAPDVYADAVAQGVLPPGRASQCKGEYDQALHAFRTLLRPYLDEVEARRVFGADNPMTR